VNRELWQLRTQAKQTSINTTEESIGQKGQGSPGWQLSKNIGGVIQHHESDDEFVLEGISKMHLKETSSGEETTDPERVMQRQIDRQDVQNRELKLVRNQIEKDKQARMMKLEMRNNEMKSARDGSAQEWVCKGRSPKVSNTSSPENHDSD
jgi:uncharacterized protein YcnI